MKEDIHSLIKKIEESNLDESNKKIIISLINQNKLEKALKILYHSLGIGKFIKELFDI